MKKPRKQAINEMIESPLHNTVISSFETYPPRPAVVVDSASDVTASIPSIEDIGNTFGSKGLARGSGLQSHHNVQFGRIDAAIFLAKCRSDPFQFDPDCGSVIATVLWCDFRHTTQHGSSSLRFAVTDVQDFLPQERL
jgi:hypothetical protein